MLDVSHVSFSYKQNDLLHDITFSLKKGEVIGFVGPSGGGKSTLLKIIAGHLDPTKGRVLFEKKILPKASVVLIPGHEEIQLVNQDFKLDLYHTVRENLFVQCMNLPTKLANELVDELLELLELTELASQQAITLSGGEQQRLALGRALSKEPKVLLLDEPFAHLDVHLRASMIRYLQQLQKIRKTAILIVSHSGQDIMQLSSKIFYLKKGEIQRIDSPQGFYKKPSSLREGLYFGDLNEVIINRKRLFFRPTAYSLIPTDVYGIEINVTFKKSFYMGHYIENVFTFKNKSLVIYSSDSLAYVEKIYI